MANNKVQLADGTTLIDLTSDTVTPQTMLAGTTAHDKSGAIIIGTITSMTAAQILAAVNAGWNSSS